MAFDITTILKYGLIGSILFMLMITIASRTGLFEAVRNQEGKFRKKVTWKSLLAFASVLSLMFVLFYLGNKSFASGRTNDPSLMAYWINSFGIFMVVHLFDLIVLDYMIVVKWHVWPILIDIYCNSLFLLRQPIRYCYCRRKG